MNTQGSYSCSCLSGYSGDRFECNNINECENSTHDCDQRATCTDTDGAFTCDCPVGWSGNGKVCWTASPTSSPSFSSTKVSKCIVQFHNDSSYFCMMHCLH